MQAMRGDAARWHGPAVAMAVAVARLVLRIGVVATMLGIMGITVVNVFMRYVFVRPISGSDEMVQFLLALLIFSAFPLVTVERRHFSVSLFARGARDALKFWSTTLELAVSAVGCAIVTLELFRQGQLLASEQMTTMVLQLPLAPLNYAMSALSVLALMGIVALLVEHLLGGLWQEARA